MKVLKNTLIITSCVFLSFAFSACSGSEGYKPNGDVAVVLLNGEHYSVKGENRRVAAKGADVTFDILLERGYNVISSFGDECSVSEELSFNRTVTFSNVRFGMTAQLQTVQLDTSDFSVLYDGNMGEIEVESTLGAADEDKYYDGDILNISATPKSGHRFICWSTNGFLNNGGSFYGYDSFIENVDYSSAQALYANFKDISNTKNTLVYKIDGGVEIEQDCSAQIERHYRANTLTAVDMRNNGIDCDGRMLTGWLTESGEYIGLGSKVATADREVFLTPAWKDYSPSDNFTVENGVITSFDGEVAESGEIVIPNSINGVKVTGIGANAFENCVAKIYYVPDTIETIADDAFLNCESLTELYISDNITDVTDNAFKGCVNFKTLHVNAYSKPKHVAQDVSVICNNYDRLALNADNGVKKVVVLGGSGVQSSYSLTVIGDKFAEKGESVETYNFGWSAHYCGLAQFEIINNFLREGDVFIHAPEHYYEVLCGNTELSPLTGETRIALTDGAPYIYRLAESNWQLLSYLTVNRYSNIFAMLTQFNELRANYAELDYSNFYDDVAEEGYGYRPTNEQVLTENGEDRAFGGANDIMSYIPHFEWTKKYIYGELSEGVVAYVTFPALNRESLKRTYGEDEESVKNAADEYTAAVKESLKDMNLKVILSQYECVYDGRHFFNHDYHLGYPTRDAHTEKVIAAVINDLYAKMRGEK